MAATKEMYNVFTSEIIHTAVISQKGSRIFIKKIIPIAIASILYKRTNLNRTDFIVSNYESTSYAVFCKKVKSPILKLIVRWIAGAFEALDKNYLRDLYLIFTDQSDVNKVLESYKFQIKYLANDKTRLDAAPTKMSLRNSTIQVLDNVNRISSDAGILLEENEFRPYICLTYYEDVLPLNYQPPYFTSPDADLENVVIEKVIPKSTNRFIGLLNTGFDQIKFINQMLDLEQIQPGNITVQSATCEDENASVVLLDDVLQNGEDGGEMVGTSVKLECSCLLNKEFDNIELIQCSRCSTAEHLPCLGYLYSHNIVSPHFCRSCKDDEGSITLSTPGDLLRKKMVTIYRLILSYMHFNHSFPDEIVNKADESAIIVIMKKLLMSEAVISTASSGFLINKLVLNLLIRNKFFDAKAQVIEPLPDTKCLEKNDTAKRSRSQSTQAFGKKIKRV